MHFDQYAFGRRVKYLRRKRNLTLEQMSTALNISIDHLSRIELGKRGASIDLILDIADLLNVSVDFLARGISRIPPWIHKYLSVRYGNCLTALKQCNNSTYKAPTIRPTSL